MYGYQGYSKRDARNGAAARLIELLMTQKGVTMEHLHTRKRKRLF